MPVFIRKLPREKPVAIQGVGPAGDETALLRYVEAATVVVVAPANAG